MFAPSRTARIITLLVIDTCFFFVELIVGYAVGSLALVADSFHMLNDVMSLVVALYAIKLSKASASSRYSYGWHRAEILAALINGVFLLALCFSIFMEAIEKFINTPVVTSPQLVVIVGALGLASNIVGLFLFHDHDHSHSHSHSPISHSIGEAEQAVSVLETSPLLQHSARKRRGSSASAYGHPIQNRAYVVHTAQHMQLPRNLESGSATPSHSGASSPVLKPTEASRSEAHLNLEAEASTGPPDIGNHSDHNSSTTTTAVHEGHSYKVPDRPIKKRHSHSHSHSSSMNMRALVLHVLGDALGNVGVIATGLIIWLSDWKFKYYFDPIISLFITVIIFSSSMPLVRSASSILLQAVPSFISLDNVRSEIRQVPGVLSVHELHVWQLSESKVVASVHVWVSSETEYMMVASRIREVLHNHGVHSSTIQPEFYSGQAAVPEENLKSSVNTRCLLRCPPEMCNADSTCCPPGQDFPAPTTSSSPVE